MKRTVGGGHRAPVQSIRGLTATHCRLTNCCRTEFFTSSTGQSWKKTSAGMAWSSGGIVTVGVCKYTFNLNLRIVSKDKKKIIQYQS